MGNEAEAGGRGGPLVRRLLDASYQRGECTTDEIVPRVELVTAGLLALETEDTVSVALDRYEPDGLWRYIQNIPKVNIISIRRVAAV